MEVRDSRAILGEKPEGLAVEINGTVAGFIPAFDRVLIRRMAAPPEMVGGIVRPEIMREQASRGTVIAVGESAHPMPPVGAIASFSKFAEEKHFDDEGGDEYALVWNVDIRGWHNA
jgi:co-chaperonin GroES (HSP10)